MTERVQFAPDPRIAPLARLGEIARCPTEDAEAKAERRLLRRLDLREAVRK